MSRLCFSNRVWIYSPEVALRIINIFSFSLCPQGSWPHPPSCLYYFIKNCNPCLQVSKFLSLFPACKEVGGLEASETWTHSVPSNTSWYYIDDPIPLKVLRVFYISGEKCTTTWQKQQLQFFWQASLYFGPVLFLMLLWDKCPWDSQKPFNCESLLGTTLNHSGDLKPQFWCHPAISYFMNYLKF